MNQGENHRIPHARSIENIFVIEGMSIAIMPGNTSSFAASKETLTITEAASEAKDCAAVLNPSSIRISEFDV